MMGQFLRLLVALNSSSIWAQVSACLTFMISEEPGVLAGFSFRIHFGPRQLLSNFCTVWRRWERGMVSIRHTNILFLFEFFTTLVATLIIGVSRICIDTVTEVFAVKSTKFCGTPNSKRSQFWKWAQFVGIRHRQAQASHLGQDGFILQSTMDVTSSTFGRKKSRSCNMNLIEALADATRIAGEAQLDKIWEHLRKAMLKRPREVGREQSVRWGWRLRGPIRSLAELGPVF